MDYFYLITNSEKDEKLAVTNQVVDYLKRAGKRCDIHVADQKKDDSYTFEKNVPEDVECVIVLGGDGTLIQAARDMANRDVPLLGINLGTLGFLADIECENLDDSLERLVRGEYEIEQRMMLEGTVTTARETRESVSLNDVVVTRFGPLRVVDYNIYVNDKLLTTYRADGVIVATPTGSTGYSLSAGGPIVEPKANMTVVTPICPHTLNTRSIVLAAEDRIRVETARGRGTDTTTSVVTFDGAINIPLCGGDYVDIRKSVKNTKIIRIRKESFLTVLRSKFQD